MANYINKEIICEAYIHLDIDFSNFSKSDLETVKAELKAFFDARVAFLLGEQVETVIETEEGSLKVKLTAFAGIASLVGGFAATAVLNYPDFRNSIKLIYEDSRTLAEATNLETVFVTKTPSCDRLHAEARTGVVGRTAKLLTQLESLKDQATNYKAPTSRRETAQLSSIVTAVQRIDIEARALLEKVKTDEDRHCLAKGMHLAFSQLPEALPAEAELKSSQIKKLAIDENNAGLFVSSEFQRYRAAVKSAKDGMKMIGVASLPRTS